MVKRLKYPYPLVRIQWYDAESSHGWEEDTALTTDNPLVTTVGFLIKDDEKSVIVASTIDPTNRHTNARLKIPKGMIESVVNL